MSTVDWIHIILLVTLLIVTVPLIGSYMARIFEGKISKRNPFRLLERFSYRMTGINPSQEMNWKTYALNLVLFNLVGFVLLFLIQISQSILPLNPQHYPGVSLSLAFNTAISFVTNTNWQAYHGEAILSNFTQMIGLTVQNFLSAATGGAVLLAFTRGLAHKCVQTIGNFWVDLVRMIVYLLLPGAIILSLLLVSQGVIQSFSPFVEVQTLEGASQTIPMGPVASQVAIKQLGTNGGGFFGANSAHPFENPTPFSNLLELFAIFLFPSAFTYAYGVMIGSKRQGWFLFNTMLLIWFLGMGVTLYSEHLENPLFQTNILLEGKEARFTINSDLLWSTGTTATSNGSVNSMFDSLSPLAGGTALFNMMLGENIFGGIGTGMCSMLMFIILTVFISGLMVGRTPEYLGKKIEKRTVQWVMVAVLTPICLILIGTGTALLIPDIRASLGNQGPHGFSELLYAFTSAAANNGSSFAGLNANTPFFNVVLGGIMLIGRLAIIIPSLAIAGDLVQKKISPSTIGSLKTDNLLFTILLIGVIFIVGALTFFPALALGPLIEHYLMLKGQAF